MVATHPASTKTGQMVPMRREIWTVLGNLLEIFLILSLSSSRFDRSESSKPDARVGIPKNLSYVSELVEGINWLENSLHAVFERQYNCQK